MQDITVPAGTYVVAVSGGIDSMVLLDVLATRPELSLVVAHFDHGIRSDSAEDAAVVSAAAARYGLSFESAQGHLGADASEATARDARYAFLWRIRRQYVADAIITAHHQDDLLETMVLNIVRGTGRKGLNSLASTPGMLRPLLHVRKADVRTYATAHPDITWREDSTNADEHYLRNYIRLQVLPKLPAQARDALLMTAEWAKDANPRIDILLEHEIDVHTTPEGLSRAWFMQQPYDVSCEVMAAWLRQHDIREFDRRTIGDLVIAAKTWPAGKQRDVNAEYWLEVAKTTLRLTPRSTS